MLNSVSFGSSMIYKQTEYGNYIPVPEKHVQQADIHSFVINAIEHSALAESSDSFVCGKDNKGEFKAIAIPKDFEPSYLVERLQTGSVSENRIYSLGTPQLELFSSDINGKIQADGCGDVIAEIGRDGYAVNFRQLDYLA